MSEILIKLDNLSKTVRASARNVLRMRPQYDTLRYDSVYLTCSKKLTQSAQRWAREQKCIVCDENASLPLI